MNLPPGPVYHSPGNFAQASNAMLNGKSRAIDFSEGETLDEPALKELIKAGVAMNLAKVKPAKSRTKPAG